MGIAYRVSGIDFGGSEGLDRIGFYMGLIRVL